MSRTDPSAATGQQPYPPPSRCSCAHLVTLHARNGKGMAMACQWRQCECRVFVKAGASRG